MALLLACNSVAEADSSPMSLSEPDPRALVRITDFDNVFTGTGWYSYTDGQYSVVITAAHVCEEFGGPAELVLLKSPDGSRTSIGRIEYMETPDDICAIVAFASAERTIPIAGYDLSSLPFGSRVWTMGFPMDHLFMSEGRFLGVSTSAEDDTLGRMRFSMPDFFGGSGSPIIRRGRAVSVFVQVYGGFHQLTFGTTTSSIRRADHRARKSIEVLEGLDGET